jgi:hypothetical protein
LQSPSVNCFQRNLYTHMWSSNRTLLYDNKTATYGNTFHDCLPHMHPDAITIMQVPNFLMLMPRPTSDPTKRRNVKPISESRSIPMSRWRDSRIISTQQTGLKKMSRRPHIRPVRELSWDLKHITPPGTPKDQDTPVSRFWNNTRAPFTGTSLHSCKCPCFKHLSVYPFHT